MARTKSEAVRRVISGKFIKVDKDGNVLKKKRRARPGKKAAREVRKYTCNPKFNTINLIPKASFERLCREIIQNTATSSDMRIERKALKGLQQAAESYLTDVFITGRKLQRHRQKDTLEKEDIHMASSLIGGDGITA